MNKFVGKAQIFMGETAGRIEEAAKKGIEKAGELFDTTKGVVAIKCKISRKEVELEDLYTRYGKLCYNAVSEDNEEAKNVAIEIKKTKEELQVLNEKLETTAAKEDKGSTIFCTKCGSEHEEDDAFCKKCGTELKK